MKSLKVLMILDMSMLAYYTLMEGISRLAFMGQMREALGDIAAP
jgi:hypothetical protein